MQVEYSEWWVAPTLHSWWVAPTLLIGRGCLIAGLVSTVIPVYNRAVMLREAVDSVLAQSWRPIEIIIVDDGSTDDTLKVEDEIRAQHPEIVRVLRQENAGPGAARQLGLDAAQGEFVQFLDSDDLLLPGKFSAQVTGLRADVEAGISYGKTYTRINKSRLPVPAQRSGERHKFLFPTVLTGRIWETATPLYRRSALEEIGPWSARRQLEDWEFDCRAAAAKIRLHYCDEFVAEYVNHDEDRLCHAWISDTNAMRDRIAAYVQVAGHAQRAGIPRESQEMQSFARSLFWMARGAGARGLSTEARQLFDLSRSHSLAPGWDFRLFRLAVAIFGWQRSSRWAERFIPRPV